MARKMGFYGVVAYVLYGFAVYWYLFYFADTNLPFEFEGSRADPEIGRASCRERV